MLRRSGPKARALLRASAERFAQRAGLPRWQADVENTVELGGSQPNELLLMAPVAFEVGPWSDYLQPAASIQLDVRGLGLHYVMRRSFHAAASRRQSAPILRYAEGLVVVAHATLPRFDAAVLMVDIAGPRQVAAFQGDGWLNTDPYEEPKEKRLIAYPDALVGWQNGKKVYLGILGTDNLAPGPLEGVFGPTTFAGSRWEIATLGGPDPLAPVDDDDPDTSESLVGPGTAYMLPRGQDPTWPDERPKAPDPTAPGSYPAQPDLTIAGTSGLVGIQGTTEGNTGQTGYGTQAYAAPGFGSCVHYNQMDECKNCCISVLTAGLSLILTAAIACHSVSSVCLPCHFACGVVEGALTVVLLVSQEDCQKNCGLPVKF